ncbi:hypothetical protein [Aeromicrobium sp.]|uniref:hypothetical protein n=1 Tax=Aeromicrobium sp. TaxID=1871063 RepID=UPI0039E5C52C
MPPSPSTAFDAIAADLRALREEAGSLSYSEIVVRIGRDREARGVPAAASRPARTTVYDVFKDGRRRLDDQLVGEIVRALGQDEQAVAAWEQRCRRARSGHADTADSADAGAEETVGPTPSSGRHDLLAVPSRLLRWRVVLAVVAACLLVNVTGSLLVESLRLPLYLDMVGTAIAAVLLGPWWGALVGLATNGAWTIAVGPVSLPFAVVNVVGALVWGYGVRRFAMGRTLPRFFALNAAVAVCCTIAAAPIIIALGGEVGHGADDITARIGAFTHSFVVAVYSSNLLMSLVDKLFSGFIVLVLADVVRHRRTGDPDD